jgi:hypothetical protein
MGCEGLSGTITIGSGLTAIPDYFVCGNINITTISFPSNVTSIGNSSFYECTSLSGTLVIPSSIQSVGGSAFKNCSNLTGITFDGFTSAPQG